MRNPNFKPPTQEERIEIDKRRKENIEKFIQENKLNRGNFILELKPTLQKIMIDGYQQNSLAKKIKAKCLDCSAFQIKEITLCTTKTCSLWDIRPFQHLKFPENSEEMNEENLDQEFEENS